MQMLIDLISGNLSDRIRWFKTRLMARESTPRPLENQSG